MECVRQERVCIIQIRNLSKKDGRCVRNLKIGGYVRGGSLLEKNEVCGL